MTRCASCSAELPADAAVCPACGSPIESAARVLDESALTEDVPSGAGMTPSRHPSGSSASGLLSSDIGDDSGYAAGTMLAGRYRVVGLLGRGGMGHVYRADDLTLGQAVALKFLPDELSHDALRLERFRSEVRVSRQVSHPNVCRVHDIGEADGRIFLSMELVDGGDLASLLKKVGRLPPDRGLQIARQLCAGLAAAHDRGVLHRDLKPANVMIDSEGTIRIADFGLAGAIGGIEAGEIRSGTPAYMAPETLSGQEVTKRSDIYALGLVLYEIFTGRRAFEGSTFNELLSKHQHEAPTTPSDIVSDLDPEIERVVLRCLAKNPEERPPSALAVSMMLPGGDPLAAMLAAGETPSPELIARVGEDGVLAPGHAWLLLGAVVVMLVAAALLEQPRHLLGIMPLERPPAVQLDRAKAALAELGIELPTGDVKYGFRTDRDLLREIEDGGVSADERAALADGSLEPLRFWMRAAPAPLVNPQSRGLVSPTRPPRQQAGEVYASLETNGRLRYLEVVPPERMPSIEAESDEGSARTWSRVAAVTGLDATGFRPTEPLWSPPRHVDRVVAWELSTAPAPLAISRVEAGMLAGKITYLRTVRAFENVAVDDQRAAGASTASQTVNVILILAVLGGGAMLARRNIRLGRVDSHGAIRVASVIFALEMTAWLLTADHAANPGEEFNLFVLAVGLALFFGGFAWLLYMALEPELRRHWPARLISWERLLTRGVRDPLVGRHVLIGMALGCGLTALMALVGNLVWTMYVPGSELRASGMALMSSSRLVIGQILNQIGQAVFSGLFITVLVLLARLVLRRTWAAVGLASVVFIGLNALQNDPWYLAAGISAVLLAGIMYALLRFGLLAIVVTVGLLNFLQTVPVNLSLGSWHGVTSTLPLVAVALIAFAAFVAAVGRQPWFSTD